jgi:replicative DNA helicase
MKKKTLPYNILAEEIILGIILTKNDSIDFISQILPIDSFYLDTHQTIYKAALLLKSSNQKIDIITVSSWLQDNNLIKEIGGLSTLNKLVEKVINFINLDEYAYLVKDKYIRRLLINFGDEIINWGYQTNLPLEIIFNKIEKNLIKINQKIISNNLTTTSEILSQIFLDIKNKQKNLYFSGYSCNFSDLDAITQGFHKSDLIIIAGRPSMGKTAFSLNIAIGISSNYNLPIIYFSLEMTKQQIVYRLISMETKIPITRLKIGNLNQEEWFVLNKCLISLSSQSLYIDDTPNLSINQIRFKIQKIKTLFGYVGPIVIDYLQLLETTKIKENRVQEISQITRTLKILAREFNIPIIVLSQLSRNVESRNNKRPILSDLRESGCFYINKNIFNKGNTITSYFFKKKLVKQILGFNFRKTGIKPIYKIQTVIKLNIFLTSNHKFLCVNLWIRTDKVKKNILAKINLSYFYKNFYLKSILAEKISRIKYIGLKKVYDFEVPKNKNFFENGMILHNSIEQDADIVLMLYRDDYYDENSKEKNISEIIISKHRNGPLGTVKLRFDPFSTKFFNI